MPETEKQNLEQKAQGWIPIISTIAGAIVVFAVGWGVLSQRVNTMEDRINDFVERDRVLDIEETADDLVPAVSSIVATQAAAITRLEDIEEDIDELREDINAAFASERQERIGRFQERLRSLDDEMELIRDRVRTLEQRKARED